MTTIVDLEIDPQWAASFRRTADRTWVQWRGSDAGVWVQQGASGWAAGWWDRAHGRAEPEGRQWGFADRESALAQAWTFWESLAATGVDESGSAERRLLGVSAEAGAAEVDDAYQRLARAGRAAGIDNERLDELRRAYETVRAELRRSDSMDRKVRAASEREQRQADELERRERARRLRQAEQGRKRRIETERRRREAEQRRQRREAQRQREVELAEARRRTEDRRRRAEQEAGAKRAREAERRRRAEARQNGSGRSQQPGPARSMDPLAEHRKTLSLDATAKREEIVAAHRRLAKAHHPDAGGDTEHMVAINLARDALLKALG